MLNSKKTSTGVGIRNMKTNVQFGVGNCEEEADALDENE